ncbi:MAG: YceI family protein [Rhodospirillales bacterium]
MGLRLTAALAIVTTALAVTAAGVQAKPESYRIDPRHATIAFLVEHIGFYRTLGQFLEVEGSFTYDEATQELSDLEVTIPTASVFSNDAARDKHVRNADFLHSGAHPVMTFRMTGAERESETTGKVTGDLTLRGVTKPVTLDVTLNKSGPYPFPIAGSVPYVLGISARTKLNRSDFGMDYAVANGLVGDEVEIIIELEAMRQ